MPWTLYLNRESHLNIKQAKHSYLKLNFFVNSCEDYSILKKTAFINAYQMFSVSSHGWTLRAFWKTVLPQQCS